MTKTKALDLSNPTPNSHSTPTIAVEKSPAPQAKGDLSTASKIFITPYGPHRRVRIVFPTEGRTKQSFKAECDINTIMARYLKTGIVEHVRQGVARYLDVTGADFQDAQNLVAGAMSMFHSLPAAIRTQFDNNPAQFLQFMEDPANAQKAREMGLLAPEAKSSTPPTGQVASVQPAATSQDVGASGKGGDTPPTNPPKA